MGGVGARVVRQPQAASSLDTIERNLYDLSEQERPQMGVDHLPESLGHAIEETAGSERVDTALGSRSFARYLDVQAGGVPRNREQAREIGRSTATRH